LSSYLGDLRFALRTLAKSPGFTLAAVATLALGIGAASTIFAGVDALFLRALRMPDADRVMTLWGKNRAAGFDHSNVSYMDFLDWKKDASSFESIAAIMSTGQTLTGRGEPEAVDVVLATGDFFRVVNRPARLGRLLTPADDRPDAARVAVLSEEAWRRRFASDPGVLGSTLTLDSQPYTIIGVLPEQSLPGFESVQAYTAFGPDLGTPDRGDRSYLVFGRLRRGVSIESCRAELDAISRRLAAAYPRSNAGFEVNVVPLLEDLYGAKFRVGLYSLLAAVVLVLTIACANIAQLLLSRSAAREREIAVRVALGASRARIVRQMLTESVLLAAGGGALGILAAVWGLQAFVRLLPQDLARLPEIGLDGRVFAFSVLMALATAAAFGLLPALHASRAGFSEALRSASSRGAPGGRRARIQAILVASEVALAVVLLSGAGLLAKSLLLLRRVDPGFRSDHVLTMRLDLPDRLFDAPEKIRSFDAALLERLAALPGVRAAAAVTTLPFTGNNSWTFITPEGRAPAPPGQEPRVGRIVVSPDYFRAMRIPILRGRPIRPSDVENTPRVAVINQEFARRYWPGENPVGKRFGRPRADAKNPWIEVVGVAGDVRHRGLAAPVRPEMYFALAQAPETGVSLVLSTTSDPAGLAEAAKREIHAIRPDQAVSNVRTMDRWVADDIGSDSLWTWLTMAFAAAAAALAAMGLYAVVSLFVGQSRREIGIRMALGAQARDVLALVLSRSLRFAGVGMAAGLVATLALSRVVASLLYSVRPTDPGVLAGISLVLATAALAASYVPARRATRVDPARALRAE
jgi:putative ABC transport system permease protein